MREFHHPLRSGKFAVVLLGCFFACLLSVTYGSVPANNFANTSHSNACLPSPLSPHNALDTTFAVAPCLRVHSILRLGRKSKIVRGIVKCISISVINVKSIWDLTIDHLPNNAMCQIEPIANSNLPIVVMTLGSSRFPGIPSIPSLTLSLGIKTGHRTVLKNEDARIVVQKKEFVPFVVHRTNIVVRGY